MIAVLLLCLWQAPAAQSPSAPAKPAAAAAAKPAAKPATATKPAAPPGPKPEAVLHDDLAAALRAEPLAPDTINLSLTAEALTLTGIVHQAEHRGVATRVARAVAARDGWSSLHVLNHLEVAP